jgi:hypothetical protein
VRLSCKLTGLDLVDITPDPGLSALNRAHDRMFRFVKVLGRMLILRRVATADLATNKTHAEVNPHVAHLNALLTLMLVRSPDFDLIQMRAFL